MMRLGGKPSFVPRGADPAASRNPAGLPPFTGRASYRQAASGQWRAVTTSGLVALSLLCLLAAVPLTFAQRSGQWGKVRDAFVAENFHCALCGSPKNLQVHHVIPISVDVSLELVATNLITLCEHCHLEAGHLGNWQRENPKLREIIGQVGARLHELRTNETYGVDTKKAE